LEEEEEEEEEDSKNRLKPYMLEGGEQKLRGSIPPKSFILSTLCKKRNP
jgi:hypothetical protein